MQRKYILEGININQKMSIRNISICIERGILELENILEDIDLRKPEDEKFFKENLEILKRFYEKLDRDLYNKTPHFHDFVF